MMDSKGREPNRKELFHIWLLMAYVYLALAGIVVGDAFVKAANARQEKERVQKKAASLPLQPELAPRMK